MEHHYVPKWYQRSFLPLGKDKYYYLDIPERRKSYGTQEARAYRYWPVKACFALAGLYEKHFHTYTSDVIEQRFFGPIDARGRNAVSMMIENRVYEKEPQRFLYSLLDYICAQYWRTPRGLRLLASSLGNDLLALPPKASKNRILDTLQNLFQAFASMWLEGYWEIVEVEDPSDVFLVSDNPVCLYNPSIHPRKNGPLTLVPIDLAGTRTIYALSGKLCLIISHPDYLEAIYFQRPVSPTKKRTNAGYFRNAVFNLEDIIRKRKMNHTEVAQLNTILLESSERYVASVNLSQLQSLSHSGDWNRYEKLLRPPEGSYRGRGETFVSYTNGRVEGYGPYGGSLPAAESRQRVEEMQKNFEIAIRKHRLEQEGKEL